MRLGPTTHTRRELITRLVRSEREILSFADKAMTARSILYPLLVGLVPIGWWLSRRVALRSGHAPPRYPG